MQFIMRSNINAIPGVWREADAWKWSPRQHCEIVFSRFATFAATRKWSKFLVGRKMFSAFKDASETSFISAAAAVLWEEEDGTPKKKKQVKQVLFLPSPWWSWLVLAEVRLVCVGGLGGGGGSCAGRLPEWFLSSPPPAVPAWLPPCQTMEANASRSQMVITSAPGRSRPIDSQMNDNR